MDARRIIAAAIIAVATAACGSASPTFAEDDDRVIPIAPPTDTAGFVPPPMGGM